MRKKTLSMFAALFMCACGAWGQTWDAAGLKASSPMANGDFVKGTVFYTIQGKANNGYLRSDALDGTRLSARGSQTNADEGRWAIIGTADGGFQIVNKASKKAIALSKDFTKSNVNDATNKTANASWLTDDFEDENTLFDIAAHVKTSGYWVISAHADNYYFWNDLTHLGYWYSEANYGYYGWKATAANAEGDNGASFKFTEVEEYDPDTAVIHEEFATLLADANNTWDLNNVPQQLSDALITDPSWFESDFTESSEGDITKLIDNDAKTFWHSKWSGGNVGTHVHYLQVNLSEAIDGEIVMKMTRRDNNGQSCGDDNPTVMSVEASSSHDGTFALVPGSTMDLPFNADKVGEVVSGTFTLTEPKQYLRFFADKTNGAQRGYWHCGEFQLYKVIKPSINSLNPEKAATLAAAIEKAAALTNPTQEDLNELQAAFDAYKEDLVTEPSTPVDPVVSEAEKEFKAAYNELQALVDQYVDSYDEEEGTITYKIENVSDELDCQLWTALGMLSLYGEGSEIAPTTDADYADAVKSIRETIDDINEAVKNLPQTPEAEAVAFKLLNPVAPIGDGRGYLVGYSQSNTGLTLVEMAKTDYHQYYTAGWPTELNAQVEAYWAVYTSENNNTYIYNVTSGKFLNGSGSNPTKALLTDDAMPVEMIDGTEYTQIRTKAIDSNNNYLTFAPGWGKNNQSYGIWDNGNAAESHLVKEYDNTISVSDKVLAIVEQKVKEYENPAVPADPYTFSAVENNGIYAIVNVQPGSHHDWFLSRGDSGLIIADASDCDAKTEWANSAKFIAEVQENGKVAFKNMDNNLYLAYMCHNANQSNPGGFVESVEEWSSFELKNVDEAANTYRFVASKRNATTSAVSSLIINNAGQWNGWGDSAYSGDAYSTTFGLVKVGTYEPPVVDAELAAAKEALKNYLENEVAEAIADFDLDAENSDELMNAYTELSVAADLMSQGKNTDYTDLVTTEDYTNALNNLKEFVKAFEDAKPQQPEVDPEALAAAKEAYDAAVAQYTNLVMSYYDLTSTNTGVHDAMEKLNSTLEGVWLTGDHSIEEYNAATTAINNALEEARLEFANAAPEFADAMAELNEIIAKAYEIAKEYGHVAPSGTAASDSLNDLVSKAHGYTSYELDLPTSVEEAQAAVSTMKEFIKAFYESCTIQILVNVIEEGAENALEKVEAIKAGILQTMDADETKE